MHEPIPADTMNFFALSGLINGIVSTGLGVFFYTRAPQNPKHRAYGLYCLSLSLWSYFYFAWQLTESPELALLFVRLLMGGAILVPITYLYHVLTLLDNVDRHGGMLRAGVLLCGIFLLFDFTPYFISGLEPELSFKYWPRPGIVFHFYLVWFAAYAIYATSLFAVAYWNAKGQRRRHHVLLFLGAVIGYVGGSTNFPLWYGIHIPPYGNILVTVYTCIVAYTLIRYRILDFTVAMEKGLAYLLLLLIIAVPSYGILLVAQKVYFGSYSIPFSLILLLLFTLMVAGVYHMKTGTQTAIARTLFRSRYDMYETLSKFSKALVTILDLKALREEIVQTLVSVMGIQTASLYILDKEKDIYALVSSHGLPPKQEKAKTFMMMADELPYHLMRFQSILVLEELEEGPDAQNMRSLAGTLRALQAEVCLPLVNKNRLIGFCNLGMRTSQQFYSDQDLRLLTTLAQEAAIALDNAMLYEDLKRSQILVQRTDRLRSLETIAEGFAHEVRNPLTSIKTFIQLAPGRKEDQDFLGRFSQVVSEDVSRIERLIQEIFDYARYMQPRFKEENLNHIVESCLYVMEISTANQPILFEKDLAPDLPAVMVDRQQIKQVLLNLFLNALEAMKERGGTLTVQTHRLTKSTGDPWVQIEVTDTGPGISPADLEHIFDPFFSTKHTSTEREGTGLGLTIVHQIVQEHSGYIEVTSEAGKGTTFLVNFPVHPHQFAEKERTHIG